MEVEKEHLNFIEQIIEQDLHSGKHKSIVTRFPPEPNGYLHIGHSKAICLSFGLTSKYPGYTNLRFDDTNPSKESQEYVDSIREDIKWLGFTWKNELYTSDYYEKLYQWAVQLIKNRKAYVDDSSAEEIALGKGTPTQAGTDSPYRKRSVEENLSLFEGMKNGQYPEGSKVLRAKIDMASPNMHLRDPLLYRIKYAHHHRTGNDWCIYPMYDWAHGQSDSIENITHSLCSLEFEVHRPLYDWFIKELGIYPSRQIEFARLNLNYTVMSKRKLLQLVEEKHVSGWNDPRMPTISGMRRRGYTAKSIRNFNEKVGMAKRENVIDVALLEHSLREDLNKVAKRVMVVLDPVKLVILNYNNDNGEYLKAINNPEDESYGEREIHFGREIYIEREDFMENAPKKFFRLSPGGNVRLKHAFIVACEKGIYDDKGVLQEVHCTYFPESKSGQDHSGIKAKGTLHWVSATENQNIQVRLYDRLFSVENPDKADADFKTFINKESLQTINGAVAETAIKAAVIEDRFQFLRLGYFCLDLDASKENLIFNKTVGLKDSWGKQQQNG